MLAAGLKNKAISAQMYYASAYKVPVNLLFEAMLCSLKSKKTSDEMRFAAVVTLLKNGADANSEGGLYEDERQEACARGVCRAQLPLIFAQYHPDLFKVLLNNGAKPAGHVALQIIFGYRGIEKTSQEELQKSLQHLLDHGLDVKQNAYWEPYCCSPLEYARSRREDDLVKLFEDHLKK